MEQFVSFQQDLLVIGKTREEAILPFAGFYAVRAGCLLCMLGQTVPAEEFIPDGAGISLPYALFPEIYFPFECKPVPQFLLPRAFLCSIYWRTMQSERHDGLLSKNPQMVSYSTFGQIMLWSCYKKLRILFYNI
jgi:hypothetical protein